jgi:hypothetical protein
LDPVVQVSTSDPLKAGDLSGKTRIPYTMVIMAQFYKDTSDASTMIW